MTLYLEAPGGFTRWTGEAIAEVRYPLAIEQLWSAAELAAIGLCEPAPAEDIPDDKISTGRTVERVEGVVRFVNTLINKPTPTLNERREEALTLLAQKRWEMETGGVMLDLGGVDVPIRTDEVGQAKITGAIALFDNDPTMTSVDWEAQPGIWATLDAGTIRAVGVAVGRHIQACFSRARVISEAIQTAGTHAAMDTAIAEIETGWPGQA